MLVVDEQLHSRYCIIAVDLPHERIREVPELLRRLLRMPEFASRAARMGKVARVAPQLVEYYEADRRLRLLAWPDERRVTRG